MGVLQALSARAIRVPDQVAVVSIDNLEVCQYTAPPLSSYAIKRSERPRRPHAAVRLDRGRFTHKHHVLLSTQLVARQSFVPATAEPES